MDFNPSNNLPEFTPEQFNRFRQLLHDKSGMFFDETKMTVMRTVIHERMTTLGLATYDGYLKALQESPIENPKEDPDQPPTGHRMLSREMRRLVEGLAVNETAFFRNREHYRAITEEVFPRLFRRHQNDRKLRIWSAGCSTGQEPYSLAIALTETLQQHGYAPHQWKLEIVACDISERALRVAHAGRYRIEEMRGLSEEQIQRYFRPLTDQKVATAPLDPAEIYRPGSAWSKHRLRPAYEVAPNIRELVKFYFFNLVTQNWPIDKFYNFDMVLCENVTIYFSPDTTKKVIHNIYSSMNDGAFLFIGYSETLWQVSDRFKLINTQDTFYYQKPFPHEDTGRYVRSKPTTGPLSASAAAAYESRNQTTNPLRPTTNPGLPTTPQVSPVEPQRANPLINGGTNKPATGKTTQSEPLGQRMKPGGYILSSSSGAQPIIKAPGSAQIPNAIPKSNANPLASEPRPYDVPTWKEALIEGRKGITEHDFDRALASLEIAMQQGGHQVEVLCTMAELKIKLGDYQTATDLCRKAINIDRLCEAAHLMLAMIHHKEGRINDAIQEYKYTIYINLENVIALMRLADIYRNTGHNRDALREYKRALSILQQKAADEIIEDLSVGILVQACQQNIARLGSHRTR